LRLLVDTHVLLWWLAADRRLAREARRTLASPESAVFVSAASAWEISIKKSIGKLEAPDDLVNQLDRHRFQGLPVSVAHALAAGSLPRLHDDPFDRVLIAQARLEGLTIVTRDPRFQRYAVATLAA
jgi:PIN domain nuclease of toxin-antitoxin system